MSKTIKNFFSLGAAIIILAGLSLGFFCTYSIARAEQETLNVVVINEAEYWEVDSDVAAIVREELEQQQYDEEFPFSMEWLYSRNISTLREMLDIAIIQDADLIIMICNDFSFYHDLFERREDTGMPLIAVHKGEIAEAALYDFNYQYIIPRGFNYEQVGLTVAEHLVESGFLGIDAEKVVVIGQAQLSSTVAAVNYFSEHSGASVEAIDTTTGNFRERLENYFSSVAYDVNNTCFVVMDKYVKIDFSDYMWTIPSESNSIFTVVDHSEDLGVYNNTYDLDPDGKQRLIKSIAEFFGGVEYIGEVIYAGAVIGTGPDYYTFNP